MTNSNDVQQPPVKTEGDVIRWEKTTPNGFNHWRIKLGVLQFTEFTQSDLDMLDWGDWIQESHPNGMIQYVNKCSGCGDIFLGGTLILIPYYCNGCREEYYQLLAIARKYEETKPELSTKLMTLIDDWYGKKTTTTTIKGEI